MIGYVEIIELIFWLDDHSYGYGSFETVFVLSIECVWNEAGFEHKRPATY